MFGYEDWRERRLADRIGRAVARHVGAHHGGGPAASRLFSGWKLMGWLLLIVWITTAICNWEIVWQPVLKLGLLVVCAWLLLSRRGRFTVGAAIRVVARLVTARRRRGQPVPDNVISMRDRP